MCVLKKSHAFRIPLAGMQMSRLELEQPPWADGEPLQVITCGWSCTLAGCAAANLLPPGPALFVCVKENGILSEPMSNTVSLYLTVLCGGGKESLETTEGGPLEVLNSKLVSQEAQW